MNDMFKQSGPVPLHQLVNVALQCELFRKDKEIDHLKQQVQLLKTKLKSQKSYTSSVLEY